MGVLGQMDSAGAMVGVPTLARGMALPVLAAESRVSVRMGMGPAV